MVNVGKYTSPMDGTWYGISRNPFCECFSFWCLFLFQNGNPHVESILAPKKNLENHVQNIRCFADKFPGHRIAILGANLPSSDLLPTGRQLLVFVVRVEHHPGDDGKKKIYIYIYLPRWILFIFTVDYAVDIPSYKLYPLFNMIYLYTLNNQETIRWLPSAPDAHRFHPWKNCGFCCLNQAAYRFNSCFDCSHKGYIIYIYII